MVYSKAKILLPPRALTYFLLLTIGLAFLARPAKAQFSFASFPSTTGLNLQGAATVINPYLRLTPAGTGANASVWYGTQQRVDSNWKTVFQFFISDTGGFAD